MKLVALALVCLWTTSVRAENGASSQPASLNFDLLGPEAAPPPVADNSAVRIRRTMLQLHQGFGFALLALSAGTAITGQLNYSDRFLGSSTGQFEVPHAAFAYTTFGLFLATGALAVFAPSPFEKTGGTRLTLHKIGMFAATALMVAEVILGPLTTHFEGFAAQQALAVTHLTIGYTTFALMTMGVSALIF